MAELTINTGDITAALQKNLAGFRPDVETKTVGRILEVGDGIARVSGLPDVGVNELLEFEGGTRGRAQNHHPESNGAVSRGDTESSANSRSQPGSRPIRTSVLLSLMTWPKRSAGWMQSVTSAAIVPPR